MPGFAPRFALEAGFLILLGVGAGYADLRPVVIVAILGGGWLLVSLIELAVWRAQARPPVAGVSGPAFVEDDPAATSEPAPEDRDYPLRSGVGDAPSEEVEAYTRVLGGSDDPPAGDGS
jgi:hypothetical protein